MTGWLLHGIVLITTIIVMEPVVAFVHRYIMHGFGWRWHQSHHLPHYGHLEHNDWYAVIFTGLTLALFLLSGGPDFILWWIALGITIYGLLYTIVHDGLVHQRWPFRAGVTNKYLQRLVAAHHLHHIIKDKNGSVSYGFLYAKPLPQLRRHLRERRRHD